MSTRTNWLIPAGSFLVALALAMITQPAFKAFALRQAGGGTPCTPPGPKAAPVKTVTSQAFQQSTQFFDPMNPPAGFPGLKPGEDGVTVCKYGDPWTFDVDLEECTANGTCTVVAYVKTLDITLTANCTIWLPNNPGAKLTAHENGHADIFKTMFASFQTKFSNDLPNSPSASGPQTAADCPTAEAAATDALNTLLSNWISTEFNTCVNTAQAASDAYDTDTNHGQKGNQAKDAAKEAATFSKQLLGG